MTRYDPLFKSIAKLYANSKDPEFKPAPANFPFKTIYPGQLEILDKIKPLDSFCLTSHTGFGKSPVFLSQTRDTPSIIIEPRKYLQQQLSTYFHDFVLYGRSGYSCPFSYDASKTAATAPCLAKEDCDGTSYHETCQKANSTCLNKPCKVFKYGNGYRHYPCEKCEYMQAVAEATRRLRAGETVICNFGNFWKLLPNADTVVVDEADLFFKEISAPMKLKYSDPKHDIADIKSLLKKEISGLQNDLKDSGFAKKYTAQNLLYSARFLYSHYDLCFMYQRKDAYYIEIDPRNTNILCKKLFGDKRVIIVSATPGAFDYPAYSASIHQRCGIYFAPVGNLTSRSLKENPYLMSSAAKAIAEISMYMELAYDADKVIIFCGNIGTHAVALEKCLGESVCDVHERGNLAGSVEKFQKSDKKYFLVAGAEYGLDAKDVMLQFILKFPFPTLDEKMNTMKRSMGPEFAGFYASEARTRIIQASGRNVRGFNDFGVTICLDSKIVEDFTKHDQLYPSWFRERVDRRIY